MWHIFKGNTQKPGLQLLFFFTSPLVSFSKKSEFDSNMVSAKEDLIFFLLKEACHHEQSILICNQSHGNLLQLVFNYLKIHSWKEAFRSFPEAQRNSPSLFNALDIQQRAKPALILHLQTKKAGGEARMRMEVRRDGFSWWENNGRNFFQMHPSFPGTCFVSFGFPMHELSML